MKRKKIRQTIPVSNKDTQNSSDKRAHDADEVKQDSSFSGTMHFSSSNHKANWSILMTCTEISFCVYSDVWSISIFLIEFRATNKNLFKFWVNWVHAQSGVLQAQKLANKAKVFICWWTLVRYQKHPLCLYFSEQTTIFAVLLFGMWIYGPIKYEYSPTSKLFRGKRNLIRLFLRCAAESYNAKPFLEVLIGVRTNNFFSRIEWLPLQVPTFLVSLHHFWLWCLKFVSNYKKLRIASLQHVGFKINMCDSWKSPVCFRKVRTQPRRATLETPYRGAAQIQWQLDAAHLVFQMIFVKWRQQKLPLSRQTTARYVFLPGILWRNESKHTNRSTSQKRGGLSDFGENQWQKADFQRGFHQRICFWVTKRKVHSFFPKKLRVRLSQTSSQWGIVTDDTRNVLRPWVQQLPEIFDRQIHNSVTAPHGVITQCKSSPRTPPTILSVIAEPENVRGSSMMDSWRAPGWQVSCGSMIFLPNDHWSSAARSRAPSDPLATGQTWHAI